MNDDRKVGFAWIPLIITVGMFLLKVTGTVDFSWWYLLLPFAVYIAIVIVLLLTIVISIFILCNANPEAMMIFKEEIEKDPSFMYDRKRLKEFFDTYFPKN